MAEKRYDTKSALAHMQLMLNAGEQNCTLVREEFIDVLKHWQTEHPKHPEVFRREQPSVPTLPIDPVHLDYAFAGSLIDVAMHHLNESLPTGQKRRSELAMRMLQQGVQELSVWMRARGYDV